MQKFILSVLATLMLISSAYAQSFTPGAVLNESFSAFPPQTPLPWRVSPETGYTYGPGGTSISCPTWSSAQYMLAGVGNAVPKLAGDSLYAVFAAGLLTNEDPEGSLILPALAPTAAQHTLTFRVAEIPMGEASWISDVGPQLYVEVSYDNSTTFTESVDNVLMRLSKHNEFDTVPRFADVSVDFTRYIGTPIVVRFRGVSDYGGFLIAVDNIRGVPFNVPPTDLSVSKASFNTYKSVSLRQASSLCPSAQMTNLGSDVSTPVSLNFSVTPGDYTAQVSVDNLTFGASKTFAVDAANAFTPTATGRYLLRASVDAAATNTNSRQDTTSITVTQRSLACYNGNAAATLGNVAHDVELGTVYELVKPDVISSLTLNFALFAMGQFPTLNIGIAIYRFNADSTLTRLYEDKTCVRRQGQSTTETYAIEPLYLEAGKYLFAVQQLDARSLCLAADNVPGNTVFEVVNGKAKPTYYSGNAAISVNTGQAATLTPARHSERASRTDNISVTFLDGMKLQLTNPLAITITDDAGNAVGGISANFANNVLSIAHSELSYNTTYTVTVPTSAMSNLWDEVKWQFTTEGNPATCLAPSKLVASELAVGSLKLGWRENNAATSWEIKYGPRGFDPATSGTSITASTNPFTVSGLAENTKYELRVRSLGCVSAWSDSLRVKSAARPVTLYGIQNYDDGATMGGGYYLVSLSSDAPHVITRIKTSGISKGHCGVYMNSTYWALSSGNDLLMRFDRNFNKIDERTCYTPVNDVAYDYSSGTLYGVTGTSSSGGAGQLYTLDATTGDILTAKLISPVMMIVACDINGRMYGISQAAGAAGTLYEIDPTTTPATTTPIVVTGLTPEIAGQALAFDYSSGRLFWGYYNNTSATGSLIEFDLEDRTFTNLGLIANNTSASLLWGLHTRFDFVRSVTPAERAVRVPVNTPITVKLDPQFCTAAGNLSAISISPSAAISASLTDSTLTITHARNLAYNTTYTVTIPKRAIVGLPGDYSWTFTTALNPSGCYAVDSVMVRNVGVHSATVSWKDYSNATSWQVNVCPRAGSPNYEGSVVLANTKTDFQLDNLADGKNFTVYVRAVCSGGGYGPWSTRTDSADFHTQKDCSVPIADFPWTEHFENSALLGCWQQYWNNEWRYEQASVWPGDGTQPAFKGNSNLHLSVNNISGYYRFITPKFDLTSLTGTNPVVDFWYTAPDGDELRVYYKTAERGVWRKLWESATVGDKKTVVSEWTRVALKLPNVNDTYYLMFEENNLSGVGTSIDELSIHSFNLTDVSVRQLIAPQSSTSFTGAERVTVRLFNEGSAPVANFKVSLEMNGQLLATETVRQSIPSVSAIDYTFDAPANMQAYGTYTFKIYTSLSGDYVPANDTLTATVRHIDCNSNPLPWSDDFETPATIGCFKIGNVYSADEDTPMRSTSFSRSGKYSWMFSREYSDNTYTTYKQYLILPKMQPSVGRKYIELYDYTNDTDERIFIGYSTTNDSIENFVWADSIKTIYDNVGTWQRYFSNAIPPEATYIALWFEPTDYCRSFIDDIKVGEQYANDISLLEISAPRTAANLSSKEPLRIKVQNVGTDTIHAFGANVFLNNVLLSTTSHSLMLAPFAQAQLTVDTLNLAAYATYNIRVELTLDGETALANNVDTATVENYPCAINISDDYLEDFEWDAFSSCWLSYRGATNGVTSSSASYWKLNEGKLDGRTVAHSGTHSMRHPSGAAITNDKLVSPQINLPADKRFKLVFWSYNNYASDYLTYKGRNSLWISRTGDLSADTGWTELWYAPTVVESWVRTEISLAPYAGQSVYLAFKYEGANAHDWYIDDMSLQEILTPNATMLAVASPAARSFDIGIDSVVVTVVNNGKLPIDSLVLSLDIDGVHIVNDTVRNLNLGLGARYNHTFSQRYDFSAQRTYHISANLSMADDSDPYDNATSADIRNAYCRVRQLPWATSFEGDLWQDVFTECWTLIDRNIDGLNWNIGSNEQSAHTGSNFAYSESHVIGLGDEEYGVQPDNYMVLPPMQMPAVDSVELRFWVTSGETGPEFFKEHYEVWVSTTGSSAECFTDSIYGETLDSTARQQWGERVLVLNRDKYKGKVIYIAFVHNRCYDQFALAIDDISLTELHPVNATLAGFRGLSATEYGNAQCIRVELVNTGTSALTQASIAYDIDGVVQDTVAWSGNLKRRETAVVTLGSNVPMADGKHTITACIQGVAGDGLSSDDTARITINVRPAKTLPYKTEFDGSFDEWTGETLIGGVQWIWAAKSYSYLPLVSATKENGYALYDLMKNGKGGPTKALAALVSPGFDLSSVAAGEHIGMTFTHLVRNYATTTVKLQASSDNFVDSIIDLWTWKSSTLQEASEGVQHVDLSALAGNNHVRFRFLHEGNEAYGWAIDDIGIAQPEHAADLMLLSASASPTINVTGDTAQLNATVTNIGNAAQANVRVDFTLNGATVSAEIPSLAYSETRSVSVRWPCVAGIYNVVVSLPADDNADNNTLQFTKYVAEPLQLHDGFEDMANTVGWSNDGLWAIMDATTEVFNRPYVYEANRACVAGYVNHEAYNNAKLVTPLLTIADGDWIAFYAKYLNVATGAVPTVQLMYNATLADSGWRALSEPVMLSDEFRDYKFDLAPLSGQYYLGIFASGSTNTAGRVHYTAIDHVIGPTRTQYYDVEFNIRDRQGLPLLGATLVFNGDTAPVNSYLMEHLLPGTYGYTIIKPNYSNVSGTATIVSDNLKIDITMLKIAFSVTFDVRDSLSGAPIGSAMLVFNGVAQPNRGMYSVQDYPLGTYTYSLASEGYTTATGSISLASDTTITVLLSAASPTGIDVAAPALALYPNPTTGEFHLAGCDVRAGDRIEVFSLDGLLLKAFAVNGRSLTANIEALPQGTYIVRYGKLVGKVTKK